MTCPGPERLREFADGDLDEATTEAIARHLDGCVECRRHVESEPSQVAWGEQIHSLAVEQERATVDVSVPAARLNELLTDYEVLAEIGRGGMGIVYRARQVKLNRVVALKVLPALLAAVRPDAIARFRREAELAARLKHNNIIAVYDFGEVEGTLYYAMELIEGRPLSGIVSEIASTRAIDVVVGPAGSNGSSAEARVPMEAAVADGRTTTVRIGASSQHDRAYFRRVADWTADVGEALHYAHEQGVIHRDIKPSNLLLSREGRLMISDFGLAHGPTAQSITASRSIVGTLRYMSPEQLDDAGEAIDRRADVYGLGATLYELLAFQPMFAGRDDRDVLSAVLNNEPPPPRRFVRQVPRELETICLKALEKDRNARYATAKDMADDLRRWLLGVPILAQRPTLAVRAIKLVRRKRGAAILTAGLVGVSVLCGVTYAAYVLSSREANEAKVVAAERGQALAESDEALADQRGRRLFDAGRLADALKLIDETLVSYPTAPALLRTRARVLTYLDRDREALPILIGLTQRDPNDCDAHYQICTILMDRKARKYQRYSTPQSSKRTLPVAERRHLVKVHEAAVHRLKPQSAQSSFLRGLRETDARRAIELFSNALRADPGCVEALAERIHCLDAIGDYSNMLLDAERAVALRPGWATASDLRASALYSSGRFQDAEQEYSRAIEKEPREASYWQSRGLVRTSLGRHAEAVADASKAVEFDGHLTYAFACRARAYAGLGQIENALDDLRQALMIDPSDIELYLQRVTILLRAGKTDAAVEDCNRIIALKPDEPRAYSSLGAAFALKKRYGEAVAALSESIRLDSTDPSAHRNRGFALTRLGRYQDAAADYTGAITLDPGVPGDLVNRGRLRVRTQDYEGAVRDYSALIARDGTQDLYRALRGMAFELGGAAQFARSDYAAVSETEGLVAAYARLWMYLLRRESGERAAAPTFPPAQRISSPDAVWVQRLFAFFAGEDSAEWILEAAQSDAQRAEAHYYIGMQHLLAGRAADARKAFESCLALKQDDVFESDFARARLAQLDSKTVVERAGNDK